MGYTTIHMRWASGGGHDDVPYALGRNYASYVTSYVRDRAEGR